MTTPRSAWPLAPALAAALAASCTFTPPNGDPPCASQCTTGATRCAGLLLETCGDVNGDGCTEYAAGVPCTGGSCSLGVCGPADQCADDCTMNNVSQCSGDTVQICGEFDSDDCLDLGTATPCVGEDSCSSGLCSPGCLDECLMGTVICVGLLGQRVCGEWDGDPCLDLSAPMRCPTDQFCGMGITGLMMCQACSDDCNAGSYEPMCGTDTFTECVTNGDVDPCYEVVTVDCTDCLTRPKTDACFDCCVSCGDFICTPGVEDTCSCGIDCGVVCGDGCCGLGENTTTCCMDCTCPIGTMCFPGSGCF